MFSNLKISTRLITSIVVLLMFIITIGVFGSFGMRKMVWYINDVANSDAKLVEYTQRCRVNINALGCYERDLFLNIGNSAKMAEYKKKWDETLELFNARMNTVAGMADPARDKQAIEVIKKYMATYVSGFNGVYDRIRSGAITSPQEAENAMAPFEVETQLAGSKVNELAVQMDKRMEEMVTEANAGSTKIQTIMIGLALTAVIFSILLATLVVRSILKPLNRLIAMLKDVAEGEGDLTKRIRLGTNDELGVMAEYFNLAWDKLDKMIAQIVEQSTLVGTYAGQLLIESSRIAKNSRQISGQSTAVATASEEMSATSNDIARNCAMAADNSREASNVASGGQSIVQKTIDRMDVLKSEVETSSQVIMRLGASSEKIGEIANTIQDIADQTNLLALNAAIEAARAGEQGRGFAVVADEVRALAERTAHATREIGEMIGTIQSETVQAVGAMRRSADQVTAGVEEAYESGEALRSILGQVGEVTMQVSQIATAAEEQTATTVEIVGNISAISGSVKLFDHGAAAVNEKIHQLQELSEDLKKSTSIFKTDTSPLLMLDTAKHDHVMFVNRIGRCLESKEDVKADSLPDHTCCRFGKWYFNEGKEVCGMAPSFRAINGPHEMIHSIAKESVALFNRGETLKAEEKLAQVENISVEIVNLLEQIKGECTGQMA